MSNFNVQDSPHIAVVVVTYNSAYDLERCVASLVRLQYGGNLSLLVVDNGSRDVPPSTLRHLIQRVRGKLILNRANTGFAAANNIGIHNALLRGAEYIWLLNADTEVDQKSLTALLAASRARGPQAALGSKILYPEQGGRTTIWSAGGQIDFEAQEVAMYGSGEEDHGQHDEPRACDYLPGCSLFFHRSLVAEAGLMPEEYFLYFEETEWCTRMLGAGLALWYVPESIVIHHFFDRKLQQPLGVYYYNRNGRRFWFTHGSRRQKLRLALTTLARDLLRVQRALSHAPTDELRRVFKAQRLAYIHFLLGRTGKVPAEALR